LVWTVHYADADAEQPTGIAVAASLGQALDLARELMGLGKAIHWVRGDEGTWIPREIVEERVKAGSRGSEPQ
jgi:hypothetical protein